MNILFSILIVLALIAIIGSTIYLLVTFIILKTKYKKEKEVTEQPAEAETKE